MRKKTEFTDIIKIEKNKIQNLEKKLQQQFATISKIEKRAEQVENEILEIDYPISGTFSMLQQYNLAMHNMKNEIQNLEKLKKNAQSEIWNIQQQIKKVNLEMEKFKFLEDEVLKKRLKELQKQESKNLDEIATILFSNSKIKK